MSRYSSCWHPQLHLSAVWYWGILRLQILCITCVMEEVLIYQKFVHDINRNADQRVILLGKHMASVGAMRPIVEVLF